MGSVRNIESTFVSDTCGALGRRMGDSSLTLIEGKLGKRACQA